jgi:Ni/Fe-hydrogenase subunit HybB-like protein
MFDQYSQFFNELWALLVFIVLRFLLPLAFLFGVGWLLWRFFAPQPVPSAAKPERAERFAEFVMRVRELPSIQIPELSPRQILGVFTVLMLWIAAAGFIIARVFWGLGTVTALSDTVPWGLWIGFDVMTGVALAAGGFVIAATVYVFRLERYRPILRPAVLTALIGYGLVIVALLVDLGRWYNIWHPIIMWNPHSVMFEVAWCVMLYTTVLLLEFSPAVWERFKIGWAQKLLHKIVVPLVILGVMLSTLHQSSLGSLYLIFATKLSPFWYTPLLPVLFFVSAITVGLSVVTVECSLAARAFGLKREDDLLAGLARASAFMLSLYLALKVGDLVWRGQLPQLFALSFGSFLMWLELLVGIALPLVILSSARGRQDARRRFRAALFVIGGILLNRMNVAVFGFYDYTIQFGTIYIPSLGEWVVTLALVAAGVAAYVLAVKLFPVLPREEAPVAVQSVAVKSH